MKVSIPRQPAYGLLLITLVLGGCKGEETAASPDPVPAATSSASPAPSAHPSVNPETFKPGARVVQVKAEAKPGQPTPGKTVQASDLAGVPHADKLKPIIESGAIPLTNGAFRPDETIKRSEFIRWMTAYDPKGIMPRKPKKPSFPDVPPDHPDYSLIEGMMISGTVTGYPDGTMKLDKELTREELGLIWGWYQGDKNVISPIVTAKETVRYFLKDYKDNAQVADPFLFAMNTYAKNKDSLYQRVFGAGDELKPQQPVTRSQAALWMAEYYANEGSSATPSPTPSPSAAPDGGTGGQPAETIQVSDIAGHPAERQLVKFLEAGGAKPDSDGRFKPEEMLSRGNSLSGPRATTRGE
ncbi:S-layer homology domain-containing protein [Paenibacillus sp. CC-CFT747]|nr:S-layer homology domain-containing protein [Paenibacillus sp. CC-CFT747]